MDILIGLLYLVGFLAIPVGIGLAIGMRRRKRSIVKYQELLRQRSGWRQDARIRTRVVEFAPSPLVAFSGVVATNETVLPVLDLLTDIQGSVPWQTLATR